MKSSKGVATGSSRAGVRPLLWLLFAAGLGTAGLAVYMVVAANPIQSASLEDEDSFEEEEFRTARAQNRDEQNQGAGFAEWESQNDEVDHEQWDAPRLAAENDPQIQAMQRTVRGLDIDHEFNPQYHRARVIEAQGVEANVGEACEVRILPVRTTRFNCLVRVRCGDELLYPDAEQHAGYVPCSFEGEQVVRAVDDGITSADGDPTVSIDLESGRVAITDSGPGVNTFSVEMELQSTRRI